MEDIVRNASISYSGALTPNLVSSSEFIKGASLLRKNSGDFSFNINLSNVVLYDWDGNLNTKDDQLIANGNISFNTNVIFDFNIDNYKITNITFKNSTSMKTDISVGLNYMGFSQSNQVKLAEYKFQPFVIGYLPTPIPLPIIIVPKLGVYAGINPTLLNPLSVRVKQNANLDIGLVYNVAWTPSSNFSNTFEFSNPAVNNNLELKVYAGPNLEMMLYGVAGPFAGISGRLRLKYLDGIWGLYGGLGASLGVKMELFKKEVSAQFSEIINYEKLLAEGQTPLPPPPQPSSGEIIFERTVDNNTDIYIMNSDGLNQTNLTNNPAWDMHPTWSPDGSKIAFVSDRAENRQIYIMNADGSNPIKVTSSIYAENPDWSGNENKIVFARYFGGSDRDIYIMNADGSGQTRLTNDSKSYFPSWSSDGSKIAFTGWDGDYEIYVMNKDGSNKTNLTNNGFLKWDRWQSWFPDGTKIAFASDKDNSSSDPDIYVMNADGSDQINLTNTPNDGDYYPSWSPDSKKIVYVSGTGTDAEIWIMNHDGTGKIKVTNNNYEDTRPRWAPK